VQPTTFLNSCKTLFILQSLNQANINNEAIFEDKTKNILLEIKL
jgi:hypothetical protein